MTDYPQIKQLEADLEHGEVHAVVEEMGERDFRPEMTTFDYDAGLIRVEAAEKTWRVGMDRIIAYYQPRNF